jgi:hypothetical protein
MTNAKPTKIIRTTSHTEQNMSTGVMDIVTDTTETEAKNSVELKEDAKGAIRVESYKVYHNDPETMQRLALEGIFALRSKIAEALNKS